MGISSWCKSAVLSVILLASSAAFSATIVPTPEVPFQSIMNAAQGAVGLPYGDPSFFGPEFTAEHSAGSRFQPGSITGQLPPGAAPKQKVPIKPVVSINPAKLAKSAVGSIKAANIPLLLGTEAVLWAIDQIPTARVNPSTGYLETMEGPSTQLKYYENLNSRKRSATLTGVCPWPNPPEVSPGVYKCLNGDNIALWDTYCPYGASISTFSCYTQATAPPPTPTPFTDPKYQQLESNIALITNSDWLRDLTKAKCEGSLSPEACYQDLVDRRPNQGPASQFGPKSSSATTTTNPDGTTSTTTTTTQNKYDYTYTQNSFTYRTTTTTTTAKDGQTTTTTTQDTTDPTAEPDKEPSEDEEGSDEPIVFEDSEMPEVTPFYEQKYPSGLQGVWDASQADFQNSEFVSFMNSFIPQFSGTCPAWEMNFNISSWANFGTMGFGSLCYVFDFIKVVILVTAVFTARAIVFGG